MVRLEIRNFKLNMNLMDSGAKIQLKLNKLEKNRLKMGLFLQSILKVFTFHLILLMK